MDKFDVKVEFTIKAKDRRDAWQKARQICQEHLRDLATVTAVSTKPLLNPEDYIAVNEPIRKMKAGKPEPLILTKRGQGLMPDRVDEGYQLE